MKIRAVFNKRNYLKYLSHLDLVRLFQRSFNRAQIPVRYSEGFNPHPRFSIANPLSLGIESEEEYIDVELVNDIRAEDFKKSLNEALPEDIQIISAMTLDEGKSNKLSISWAYYEIKFLIDEAVEDDKIKESLEEWLSRAEIFITRMGKKGRKKVPKQVDIIPLIGNVVMKDRNNEFHTITAFLKVGENGNLKPVDFMEAFKRDSQLAIDMDSLEIKRIGQFSEKDGQIYSPLK